MDGNKDDALKCLRIGKEALESGDRSRALKFFSKARRLDPSLPIDDLVSSAGAGESDDSRQSCGDTAPSSDVPAEDPDSPAAGSSMPPPSSSSAGPRVRARSAQPGSAAATATATATVTYTEEQIRIVREVKKEKDYYKILGLEKSCTVEDVRKAYRKLSLKVHPDKNKAPGSEEAFKAVSKAFQCLSDEEGRKRYDLVGSEEPVRGGMRRAARHDHHGFNGFYEAEFDADEIFRNFFFGGGPMATTPFGNFRFRTGGMGGPTPHEAHAGGAGGFNIRTLIQILPVLLLLLLNFLPSNEPVYSLSRTYQYDHMVETQRGVQYFVKSAKFEQDYPYESKERISLERRVEREYISFLAQNCRVELQRRNWGISYQTPHCDMLEKIQNAA